MVIGEHTRDNDLEVNPTKQKQVSNVRSVMKEEFTRLKPPKIMTLEESMAYVRRMFFCAPSLTHLADELLEITPQSIRLRKDPAKRTKRPAKD